jgi:hypothetical protein
LRSFSSEHEDFTYYNDYLFIYLLVYFIHPLNQILRYSMKQIITSDFHIFLNVSFTVFLQFEAGTPLFFIWTNLRNELIPVSVMLINSLVYVEYIKVQVVLTYLPYFVRKHRLIISPCPSIVPSMNNFDENGRFSQNLVRMSFHCWPPPLYLTFCSQW